MGAEGLVRHHRRREDSGDHCKLHTRQHVKRGRQVKKRQQEDSQRTVELLALHRETKQPYQDSSVNSAEDLVVAEM
jgi:hypothetical protein